MKLIFHSLRGRRFAFVASPIAVAATLLLPNGAQAADKTDFAISALELGGSFSKLVWTEASAPRPSGLSADRYLDLANEVKRQIEEGRASSGLLRANFNVVGTALIYTAAADPEPLSKAVAGLAAWGAKKSGDAIGNRIVADAQERARGILARGLQESGLSPAELQAMTPDQLRTKVEHLNIGGKQIGTILAGDPESLDLLRANAVDIATNIGVEALAKSKANQGSIDQIRGDIETVNKNIREYQATVSKRLDDVTQQLGAVQIEIARTQVQLGNLQQQVSGNTAAIRSLAEVSYTGWSTTQKLQAVQSGLFPNLNDSQRAALAASLQEQQKQETTIAQLRATSEDLSNLAIIAKNVGLPADAVKGIQSAQLVASGVAQFAAGNYLGAAASVTSLIGLGGPDAAAERHAAMMKYLQQQFAIVNQKLDKIIDLQINTIKLIQALADQEEKFHRVVFGQLDRIEDQVLSSHQISQAILLSQWQQCEGLVNGTALNGQYQIGSKATLLSLVNDPVTGSYAGDCYRQMTSFLDAWVKSANWSGQIISALNFPQDAISNDQKLLQQMLLFEKHRSEAFEASRDFLLAYWSQNPAISSTQLVARLLQPVASTGYQRQLEKALAEPAAAQALRTFTCDQDGVIDRAARDLICFGYPNGAHKIPDPARLAALLRAALIGPQAKGLLDTGVVLSQLSGIATANPAGNFTFASEQNILAIPVSGLSPALVTATQQQKGPSLLRRLQWLAVATVLQQSVAYGDYSSELIEKVLYNPATRRLEPDGIDKNLAPYAMGALRANPTLARNVVLLAMRHAIADASGGKDKADAVLYQRTYFGLGLKNFSGPAACGGDPHAVTAVQDLLPGWALEYRVDAGSKATNPALKACQAEDTGPDGSQQPFSPRGSGAAVTIGDVYVMLPSPLAVGGGVFEAPDSFREALRYRDRVSQAQIDLDLLGAVRKVSADTPGGPSRAGEIALNILSEGWNWPGPAKSP